MSTSPAVVRFQWPARRWAVTGRCWKGAADGRATWGCHGDCGARHWRRRVVSAIVEPGCRSGRRRARFAARCAGSGAAGCAGAGCAWAAHAAGNRAVAGILGQWAGRRGAGETRSAGNGPAALADSPARTAVAAYAAVATGSAGVGVAGIADDSTAGAGPGGGSGVGGVAGKWHAPARWGGLRGPEKGVRFNCCKSAHNGWSAATAISDIKALR